MEDVQCIFCKKSTDNVVIEENGYKGRKCPECGLIYVSPRPTFREIQELYRFDRQATSAHQQVFGTLSKRLHARHHVRMIRRFLQRGSILELGSGTGEFLDEARKEGFDAYGVEINPRLSRFIDEELSIPCENRPLNSSLFGGKKFDMVYHCDVLSHFYDPLSEFMQINAKLRDGGLVIFETGNLGDVDLRYYRWFSSFQCPDHLFFFSVDNIMNLLSRTGFQPLRVYSFCILPQLFFLKAVSYFIGSQTRNTVKERNAVLSSGDGEANVFKRVAKDALSCVLYLVRYKLGALLHMKTTMPQTIVVVARKKVDAGIAGTLRTRSCDSGRSSLLQ